ncbi:MAG TPA: carboxypeptidase-like regulatory domain-containing protein [Vicinamibacterales bacterium]
MPALFILIATFLAQSAPTATGTIRGHVLEEGSNKPIVGARVLLFPQGGRFISGPPPQSTTDADGAFAFAALAPGDYRLDVQKNGYVPWGIPQPGMRSAVPRPFHVEAGQPTIADLHLQKGGVVAGRVLDVNGEPFADARVMALRRMDSNPAVRAGMASRLVPQGQGQQTNDIGEFRVAGLAPGEYFIAVSPRMMMPLGESPASPPAANGSRTTTTTTYYPGTIDPAGAQPITVAAGETVNSIQFTMQSSPAFRVSGIVVDENGQPISNAMVMLMGDPRSGPMFGPAGSGRSDSGGRFAISNIVAGSYRINASVPVVMNSGGATGGISGGISGGSFGSVSISGNSSAPPAELVVTDGDVSGVRVVARRPQ